MYLNTSLHSKNSFNSSFEKHNSSRAYLRTFFFSAYYSFYQIKVKFLR